MKLLPISTSPSLRLDKTDLILISFLFNTKLKISLQMLGSHYSSGYRGALRLKCSLGFAQNGFENRSARRRQRFDGLLSPMLLRECSIRNNSQYGYSLTCRSTKERSHTEARNQKDEMVRVRFRLQRRVDYGKQHKIVGDHPSLGKWDVSKGLNMLWGEGNIWTAEVSFPRGTAIYFKCVQTGHHDDAVEWENGKNRFVDMDDPSDVLDISLSWGAGMKINEDNGNKIRSNEEDEVSQVRSSNAEVSSDESDGWSSEITSTTNSTDDDFMTMIRQWNGPDTVFMRSNDHSNDRIGIWNTDGLAGAALMLVQGDRDAGNWLSKLAVVKNILVDSAPKMRPDLEALAYTFVYLTWIATGAISCVETGGHHRPNHHARLAQVTFRTLEWVIGERPSSIDALIARRMHTRIPSFDDTFTHATPLTRIRDIAHRNDIPKELKQEIKHTIQNKLHRNAGPEDLVATEALLARVESEPHGTYPESFVEELKTFLIELRDFFNAGTMADLMTALLPSLGEADSKLVERFLAAKKVLDAAGDDADDNAIMDALHGATSIRAMLASGLSSGLRNDAPDRALSMRQRWRLAEIRAEDYVFMLLSRFINTIEKQGGAKFLIGGTDGIWSLPIGALVIGLRHIGLSGFEPSECMAMECELGSWQQLGDFSDPDSALRLRATLQRIMRFADSYSQLLLDCLMVPADRLGKAFGMEPERTKFIAESEIRSNIVFQISKLASLMLEATQTIANVPPYEVIVAGDAKGKLIEVENLYPGCFDHHASDVGVILAVKYASGDEEVGTLGPKLKGIILKQQIPHLSHLGVRARQENIPFISCEDTTFLDDNLQSLIGKNIAMVAHPDDLTFQELTDADMSGAWTSAIRQSNDKSQNDLNNTIAHATHSNIDFSMDKFDRISLMRLSEATLSTCGAKAAACGHLLSVALETGRTLSQKSKNEESATLFQAPDGICLPFGSMEAAIKDAGADAEVKELIKSAETVAAALMNGNQASYPDDSEYISADSLDEICSKIQDIMCSLKISASILNVIKGAFAAEETVIVRSSANVEDLAGFSGAGLYDSVPNVNPSDNSSLETAITKVWSSFYSRRAILARYAARIKPESASMGVFIQLQLAPEYSFVLHTIHPQTRDDSIIVAEIAPGMGETLASGTKGSGWRLHIDRQTGAVKTVSFANFSKALIPKRSAFGDSRKNVSGMLRLQTVDYSGYDLSKSKDLRSAIGARLGIVGRLLEAEFGCPQDIEGCIVHGQIFIVQSRPQP